jgi:SAM-dependent methyltransferase
MPKRPDVGPEDEHIYGDAWASVYDDLYDEVDHDMLDLLVELSSEPPRVLELAVGTGRVAIPLSQRGVTVSGIDISENMIDVLMSKFAGADMKVSLGDMAQFDLDETFPLVYVVFNSFFALSTQDRQKECFQTVARHLDGGGRFLLECFVPDLRRFDSENTRMSVTELGVDGAHAYEMSIHDPVTQQVSTQKVSRGVDGTTRVLPVDLRYAWPSELDLMAELAGLRLETRWSGYDRRPFGERSTRHVSIYSKPSDE